MKIDKRVYTVIGIAAIIICIILDLNILTPFWTGSGPISWHYIPITGMNGFNTYTLFWLISPTAGSLLDLILIPIFIGPLFFIYERFVSDDYRISKYSEPHPKINRWEFIKRSGHVVLLTLGLVTVARKYIPFTLFISPLEVPVTDQYNLAFTSSLLGLILPISIGLLSISWIFQDSYALRYMKRKENDDENYELEPLHHSYDSLVKGSAGFGALLFIVDTFYHLAIVKDPLFALRWIYVIAHFWLMTLAILFVYSELFPSVGYFDFLKKGQKSIDSFVRKVKFWKY